MQKGILTLAIIVAVASLLIGIKVNIQEAGLPRIRHQLDLVLENQQEIRIRLQSLEEKHGGLAETFNKLSKLSRQPPAPAPRRPQEDPDRVYDIDIAGSPVQGPKDAPVTIVEFSDLQCPFSQRFHAVIPEVLAAYPKEVKYVLKHFPLRMHAMAKPAAKATLAAGEQGKYWEMAELLFQQGRNLAQADFDELARQIGLDVKKFKKDMEQKDAEYEKLIEADMALGRSVNVRGTPTFYLNGKKTRARDLPSYKREIDALLKEKK